jgi:hypothetical protein
MEAVGVSEGDTVFSGVFRKRIWRATLPYWCCMWWYGWVPCQALGPARPSRHTNIDDDLNENKIKGLIFARRPCATKGATRYTQQTSGKRRSLYKAKNVRNQDRWSNISRGNVRHKWVMHSEGGHL